jgi:hypothetical protein
MIDLIIFAVIAVPVVCAIVWPVMAFIAEMRMRRP